VRHAVSMMLLAAIVAGTAGSPVTYAEGNGSILDTVRTP
jgi:hypothetical protein